MKLKTLLWSFLTITMLSVRGQQGTLQKYITIDQFGYRLGDMKFAVIVDPQTGFNADDSFVPGNVYEVRRWGTNETVYSGTPEIWNQGATHENSGDKGWWFTFTEVEEEGDYFVYDVEKNVRSHQFHIGDDVYEDVLKAAMRMFYYNRSGIKKEAPYAESNWVVNEIFNEKDAHAYSVDDMDNEALVKDLSQGWMDAGDSNKYVTFASSPVHMLLTSYVENKPMWNSLDLNIPESGNGIPDLLDELKWELDWVMKMQDMADGGVHIKVGVRGFGEVPWEDERTRYYEQKCSSSTIAASAMFAHAYLVFKDIPSLSEYAQELLMRAELAWSNFKDINGGTFETGCDPQFDPNRPYEVNADGSGVCCGDADREVNYQKGEASVAAAYLFAATGDQKYQEGFLEYYESNSNYLAFNSWGRYQGFMGDALTFYAQLPNADASARANIINNKTAGSNNSAVFMFEQNDDLYGANFDAYHWGSSFVRSSLGNSSYDFVRTGVNVGNNEKYKQKAQNVLHHFHGVNPLSMVYLTNMKESSLIKYGAEFSSSELFHTWFEEGTEYDNALDDTYGPAPGFMPGGPNDGYNDQLPYKVKLGNTVYDAEIRSQPKEKSFSVENLGWDDELQQITESWTLNEPAIYYQAAYVKLLANFVGKDSKDDTVDVGDPSNFVAATLIDEVEQGEAFNATINYTSDQDAIVVMRLLDGSSDEPIEVLAVSGEVVPGTDEIALSFDIPNDLTAGDFYTVEIQLLATDYETELALYPGQQLSVYLPGEKPVRHSVNAVIPSYVPPGTTLEFDVEYTTADDGNLFINIFDTSSGDWVELAPGKSKPIVADTQGTESFSYDIPADVDVDGSYFVWLTIFDVGWSNILAREQVNISFKEDDAPPATENSIAAEIPTTFVPGTTTGIEITYSTLEDANIFLNIFDDSSGEWVSLNDGASQSVVANSTGTTTLNITVPEDAREGDNYVVFLNMFNADYSATLASFPNTSVSVGTVQPPSENSISANIPDTFAPDSTTPIDIEYAALVDANIFINIFDTSSGEWVSLNDGASQPVPANTAGSVTLDITVPEGAREGDDYIVFLNLFNADYSGNLAGFPNTEVSVGRVIVPPTENSISAVIPDTFVPGSTTPIDIEYAALEDANIFINIFDTSSGEWVSLNDGASQPVAANTAGSVTLDITVPEGAREGDGYIVFLNLFNADYSGNLAGFPNTEVNVGQVIVPPTENSISAVIPDTFVPGTATPIDIEYAAIEDGNIFLRIYDASSGEWVALNGGASQPVTANTAGTVTLDVEVPEGAREGDGYIIFLRLFNGDWSGELASFPNTDVSVQSESLPVQNLLLTSMCSNDPETARRWRVRNPNDFDIDIRWEVYGTDQVGLLNAVSGDSFFETETVDGANTTKIFWLDENEIERSTVKASSGSACQTSTSYVLILNKQTGTYMRPNGEETDAQIIVAENDGTDWFLWEKVPTENGYYFLKNKKTNAYFRPKNRNNGTSLLQKPVSWNGNWTQWSESLSNDGIYSYVINRATGKHIRPANATNNAVQLQPNSWRGNWTRWIFEPVSTSLKANLPDEGITKLVVYPNPAKNQLRLHGQVVGSYTIFDISGRSVKTGALSGKSETAIDITTLETGMYLLNVPGNTFKFVKE